MGMKSSLPRVRCLFRASPKLAQVINTGATNMTKLTTAHVGVDYHDSKLQVCVMDSHGKIVFNRAISNSVADVRFDVEAFCDKNACDVHVAVEACNGASDFADELVQQTSWSVSLAHPGYVARIKQGPDKTDWGDARLLADLVRVGYLPKVWLAPKRVRELRRLVRYRQQLTAQRRNTKLRIRALLRDHRIKIQGCNAWTKLWLQKVADTKELTGESRWVMDQHLDDLEHLKGKIKNVEKRLELSVKDDQLFDKLMDVPGVGLVTAATIRAEIGRFDRFRTGKQLSRFCGLSPRNASSGNRQADAGLVKAGNPELRRVITETAHRLIRYEPRWSKLATKLEIQGKPKPLVVAAIANRWMRQLYHDMCPYGIGHQVSNN